MLLSNIELGEPTTVGKALVIGEEQHNGDNERLKTIAGCSGRPYDF